MPAGRKIMQSGLYVALSSQIALDRRMTTIADNLANMNTVGFRATQLKFDDVMVDLNAPAPDKLVVDNIPGEPQYLVGTSGQDQFVIDGQSTDFGWEATDDGGYVVWEVSSGDFDILYGFEDIVFNGTTVVIG